MKKIALFLLTILFVPAMLFAQYKVSVSTEESTDLTVDIPGYNERVPKASMNLRFEFDQASETLLVRCGAANINSNYDKVWLPQHDVAFAELGSYMSNHGVKMIKSFNYSDQESFIDFSNKTLNASIQATGMTFSGVYDLKSSRRVKKELDHQMVPLDGKMELDLSFKVNPGNSNVTLKFRNPIPMDRSGRKGTLGFVADDITITIKLERCKDAEQMIQTIQEYEALFQVAEDKLNELKKSPSTQKSFKDFVMNEFNVIDLNRFKNADCEDIQRSYQSLMDCIGRIEDMGKKETYNNNNNNTQPSCDTKKLEAEVKTVTNKLNNLVNDWSLASDAAAKAEKKAAFESEVKKFDAKLNELPSGCKDKLDKKLLKNYEFVKKLIK